MLGLSEVALHWYGAGESRQASGIAGQMITGPSAWPSYTGNGPITVAIAEQTTEPCETSGDPGEEPHLLRAALEEQLDGCRVSRILGVGGVSACFAANMQHYGDVAIKVTRRGSGGGSSWLAEAAEVCCTTQPLCNAACSLQTLQSPPH